MDWVEVRGRNVEIAVEAALAELGLESAEDVDVQVLVEGSKGFLGIGGQETLVRVTRKSQKKQRRRRRRGGSGGEGRKNGGKSESRERSDGSRKSADKSRDSQKRQSSTGKSSRRPRDRSNADAKSDGRQKSGETKKRPERKDPAMTGNGETQTSPEEQAEVISGFLEGLLDAYGLEGTVATQVDEEIIIANVTGEQTEALVGNKGAIMQAVGEVARTVVQRKTHQRAKLRLDVSGYLERRREALRIYTGRLAQQVLDEGGELMLEPMNPADRKVVHDAVVEIEGVRSFSEGEEPNRSVVIALAPGVEPRGEAAEASPDGASRDAEPGDADDVDGVDDANGADDDE